MTENPDLRHYIPLNPIPGGDGGHLKHFLQHTRGAYMYTLETFSLLKHTYMPHFRKVYVFRQFRSKFKVLKIRIFWSKPFKIEYALKSKVNSFSLTF